METFQDSHCISSLADRYVDSAAFACKAFRCDYSWQDKNYTARLFFLVINHQITLHFGVPKKEILIFTSHDSAFAYNFF